MDQAMGTPRRRLTVADLKPAKPKPVPEAPEGRPADGLRRKRQRQRAKLAKAQAWAWPEAKALTVVLRGRYPALFSEPRKPLARGVHRQIAAELGCTLPVVSLAMRAWTGGVSYLRAMAAGGPRHTLDGSVCGEVTDIERAVAAVRLAAALEAKRQRKQREREQPERVAA